MAPRSKPPPLPKLPLTDADRLACLRLIRSENVGAITFRKLLDRYGSAQRALDALPELSQRGGRYRPIRICPPQVAEQELDSTARIGARLLFVTESGYPEALATTDGCPPVLCIKGDPGLLYRPSVGIVGSRMASAAGQKLTRMFAEGLGRAGYVVTSGLALGIDTAAHTIAIEHGTIAVVAGGIDILYPPQNSDLQRAIGARGLLVSEQPPGFQPRGVDFPRRNRIISGLSLAVVVVEAARRSGSLITARRAVDQGREVLAVPGHPLDPRAEGTNHLLREGATLVTSAEDIISALQPFGAPRSRPPPNPSLLREEDVTTSRDPIGEPPQIASDERARISAVLGPAPIEIDEIARTTGLSIRVVQSVLLELALAGRVEYHGQQLVSSTGTQDT